MDADMIRNLAAEAFGTFWLVLAVLGTALLAAGIPEVGVGFAGVSLAAGFAVMSMAYAVGGISGGHFNPAVSLGLAIAGRFRWPDLIPYWIAQIAGAAAAAAVVYLIASGTAGFQPGGFASNGYDMLSPGGYSLFAAFIAELVLTAGSVTPSRRPNPATCDTRTGACSCSTSISPRCRSRISCGPTRTRASSSTHRWRRPTWWR